MDRHKFYRDTKHGDILRVSSLLEVTKAEVT